jgi:hypothetical protein
VPVPYFLLFLYFRKATHEIFLELDETKAEPPIFMEASQRSKMRRRGARIQAHHRGARPSPWSRHPMVRPGGPPPDAAISPIKSPRREKPKDGSLFLETYCKPPSSSKRDQEDLWALPGTLSEREIPIGGLLHHHGHLRSDVWVVYLGLRVHSSS